MPPSRHSVARRSARPATLATTSVPMGWTAQRAAAKNAGPARLKRRSASAKTSQTFPQVQQEVQHVISGRAVGVAQDRIVQEERRGSERPVEAVGAIGIPVVPGENQPDIGGRDSADARIVADHAAAVEGQVEPEGIQVGGEGNRAERPAPPPGS